MAISLRHRFIPLGSGSHNFTGWVRYNGTDIFLTWLGSIPSLPRYKAFVERVCAETAVLHSHMQVDIRSAMHSSTPYWWQEQQYRWCELGRLLIFMLDLTRKRSDIVLEDVELSDCPKSTAGEVSEPATRDTPAHLLYRPTFNPELENVELYRQGGFHPIRIGDSLHDNRFKIVYKLGFGGWSTVWLAFDNINQTYIALKINIAEEDGDSRSMEITRILNHIEENLHFNSASSFIDQPLEHFILASPNGIHNCSTSPIYGPSVAQLIRAGITLPGHEAQRAALQVTQALSFLHSEKVGIAHGDLTTNNILLSISPLSNLSTSEIYTLLGTPITETIHTLDSSPLSPSASRYLVQPLDPTRFFSLCTGNIKLIDFGESFFFSNPPEEIGTATQHLSPEAIACFDLIGPLPAELTAYLSSGSGNQVHGQDEEEYGDSGEGDVRPRNLSLSLRSRISAETQALKMPDQYDTDFLNATGAYKVWIEALEKLGLKKRKVEGGVIEPRMSGEEAAALAELLEKVLVYDIEERVTAEEMLGSSWFSRVFGDVSGEGKVGGKGRNL
ncbi:kinase-like domain-containing protein [Halenospora varia]|nr:kinase-like domain-containing protein [Halenospora varia]